MPSIDRGDRFAASVPRLRRAPRARLSVNWRDPLKKLLTLLALLLSLSMVAAACGDSDSDDSSDTTEAAGDAGGGDSAGALGEVRVAAGESIQIRSLNAITGDVAFLGVPNQRAVELAIADYGQVKGFDVSMGTGLDDLCSADGGQAAAQTIVADEHEIGRIEPVVLVLFLVVFDLDVPV